LFNNINKGKDIFIFQKTPGNNTYLQTIIMIQQYEPGISCDA